MDYHHHARLTVRGREALVQCVLGGQSLKAAAAAFRLSRQSAAKWVQRYRAEGISGLEDRSSRPHCLRVVTSPEQIARIAALRRERWTGVRIAQATALSRATISRTLRRLRLSRMRDLQPPLPVQRYEHPAPGDLLHLDIKQLGRIEQPGHRVTGIYRGRMRGPGWEYLHVAIDDHSRIGFSAVYPDQDRATAVCFLHDALAYYRKLGIRFKAILTDNGDAYRSRTFRAACRALGLKQRFTRPYTPRTNGKAERFIQTALREWADARIYQHSDQRSCALRPWLHQYNWHRPHASLNLKPPISRTGLHVNNLLRLHT